MNTARTIEGRWWIHGDDKPPQFGILSFDPEKDSELRVKIPQARTNDDAFHAMLAGKSEDVPTVIHGADDNKPLTLFGCSLQRWSKGGGLDSLRIHIQVAVLNHTGSSWDESQFPAAAVKFTLLTRWLNQNFLKKDRAKQKRAIKRKAFLYEFELHEDLEFELCPGAKIRIQGFPHPSTSWSDFSVKQVHTLYFDFGKPLSAMTIYNSYALVFLRLLSLLTGERIFIEELVFFNSDPFKLSHAERLKRCELLIENHGVTDAKHDIHAAHMITSYDEIAPSLGTVLKRWFQRQEQLRPVLDLYFAVLSNWVVTDHSRLLFLAQALEVYHGRSGFSGSVQSKAEFRKRRSAILAKMPQAEKQWLKEKLQHANQKTLAERLKEILDSHASEALRLTFQIPDFAAKVRHARNYYTHYDEELQNSGKVAKGLELRRITYALFDLLQICLLKELGIEGKAIVRILERNSSMEWEDLRKAQTAPK